MKPILGVLLVALAWVSADEPFRYYGHDYDRTPLGNSIDKATLKVLKEMYNAGDEKNVITSPLGILVLLAMYAEGAGAGSKQQIGTLLGQPDQNKQSQEYSGLSNYFAQLDPNFLTVANKMYVGEQFEVVEAFDAAVRSYNSEVDKINFAESQKAADTINAWAAEKTKDHIKTPVSADDLGPDVAAALFNVIFFQGHWHVPFNASNTKDEDFHVDKNTVVKKPTMKLLQSLFYAESEDLGAKLIELPYKEDGFRMVVVLPNEIDGLPSVLEKAAGKGLLEDVFKLAPAGAEVDLSMPKFEIKSKHDLNDILPKVGVSKIFEEAATGIVKGPPVKVSKAFQEAFVKVDEEGATAGAFTGAVMVFLSSNSTPPPPIKIHVDHPFLFLILHKDKTLFAGTIAQ